MAEENLVFGADGGGTKTLGVIAGLTGDPLAESQSGPSNPNVVGIETAARNLLSLVRECCREAHCTVENLRALCCGLAGVASSAISDSLLGALTRECEAQGIPPLPFSLETDARISLEGAFDGGPGVIVIAGTGSNVLGKTPSGEQRMTGGWGRVLGDEGSGYYIGLEALKALTREYDGRGSSGSLRHLCGERFGWTSREKIITAVYKEQFAIPSLAPIVLEAAAAGDWVSIDILERGAAHLVEHVAVFAARWPSGSRLGVVFIGGLIDHDTVYTHILRGALEARFPAVTIRPPLHPPVTGAVMLARKRLHRE